MSLIQRTRRAITPPSDGSTLFECRVCGVSEFSPMRRCPSCDSTDIATFSFD